MKLLFAALIGFVMLCGMLFAHAAYQESVFVRSLEAQMGIIPGATRVLPACSCTVRYLGTSQHGNRYSIELERLD